MTRALSVFIFLIFVTTISYNQNFEPLDLAGRIFGKDNLENIDIKPWLR
jgi:hypothetical protein